ncbi:MAG: ADOP family duplicated permease, partial [Acidobacteriaceae bacterium]
MTNLWNDLRYALRQLRKSPGFTVLAVLLLTLGIGINAAMFTVVDTVLLRPLPFPHPSQIVALSETDGKKDTQGMLSVSSLPDLMDWRAQAHAFQDIGWYRESPSNLQKPDGSTEFAVDMQTSANFFSLLQVRPFLGRSFSPYEDQAGKTDVVILSYSLWNSAFHADKAVLGKQVKFGKQMYTVIGVMPKGLYFPANDDGPIAWSPLPPDPSALTDRNSRFLNGIGRLKPGTSIAAANAELDTIQANIARRYASLHLIDHTLVVDYRSTLLGHVQPALFALEAAVLAVWLIACANLASLMLARANGRRHEIAIRSALGAGKSRLAQQTLTEGLVLGLSGGALGLALAVDCLHLLRQSIGSALPRSQDVHINWQVLLALLALSMLSTLFFGLAPALQAATTQPQEALQDGTRSSGSSRHQSRLRDGLVIGQIALSLVLLVASGLLLRTLYALRNLPLGFQQHNLVIGFMFLPQGKYKDKDVGLVLYQPLLDRLRQVPGVESAGLVSGAPLSPEVQMQAGFAIVGRPSPSKDFNQATFRVATRNIFRVLDIPLVQGRFFNETDTLGTPVVAVVNQSFARKYFPGEDPLGKRLDLNADNPTEKSVLEDVTIVGVAGDVPQG